MEIDLIVPGVPIPQGSMKGYVRGGKVRVTSDNPKLANWRQMIAGVAFAKMRIANEQMARGPVLVQATFFLPKPKSIKGGARATKRPDLDKLARALFDGLTDGGVWLDDSQVVSLVVDKSYAVGVGPRLEAKIRSIG